MLINKLRSSFDYIVVDTAAHLDELNLELLDMADRVLLLSTPTLPSVKNARTVLDLAQRLGYDADKVKLVLNRVNSEFERTKVSIACDTIERALKAQCCCVHP